MDVVVARAADEDQIPFLITTAILDPDDVMGIRDDGMVRAKAAAMPRVYEQLVADRLRDSFAVRHGSALQIPPFSGQQPASCSRLPSPRTGPGTATESPCRHERGHRSCWPLLDIITCHQPPEQFGSCPHASLPPVSTNQPPPAIPKLVKISPFSPPAEASNFLAFTPYPLDTVWYNVVGSVVAVSQAVLAWGFAHPAASASTI